jgi:hypothetical protein
LKSSDVVRLKGFRCRTGSEEDAPQVKIEFHRLSDMAASMIVAKRTSELLEKTIGTLKVIENGFLKAYPDILSKFGTTARTGPAYARGKSDALLQSAGRGAGGKVDAIDTLREADV